MCFIYIYISLSWLEFEFKVGINISQLPLIREEQKEFFDFLIHAINLIDFVSNIL